MKLTRPDFMSKLAEKNMTEMEKIARREAARKKDAELKLSTANSKAGAPWSKEDMVLLIKATKKFPSGSNQRWEQIAAMVNKLTSNKSIEREASDCIKKANELAKLDKQWSTKQQKTSVAHTTATSVPASVWSDAQQKQLERGLRKFPSGSVSPEERWKKISAEVEGKSTEECISRFNFLRDSLKK